MKARKHGEQWLITYRCPGIKKAFNELFATQAEANVRIAEIQLAREQGTLKPPVSYLLAGASDKTPVHKKSVTVADLMDKYVNLHSLSRWSEHTLSNNQHRIRDYILPYIGEVPLYCLTTAGLEEYYQLLATKPAVKMAGREKEGKTISLSVIEKVHALMRSALNQAIRWGMMPGPNPAMTVELPKRQVKPRETWPDA